MEWFQALEIVDQDVLHGSFFPFKIPRHEEVLFTGRPILYRSSPVVTQIKSSVTLA